MITNSYFNSKTIRSSNQSCHTPKFIWSGYKGRELITRTAMEIFIENKSHDANWKVSELERALT